MTPTPYTQPCVFLQSWYFPYWVVHFHVAACLAHFIYPERTEYSAADIGPWLCKVTPAILHCVKSLRSSYTGLYPQSPWPPWPFSSPCRRKPHSCSLPQTARNAQTLLQHLNPKPTPRTPTPGSRTPNPSVPQACKEGGVDSEVNWGCIYMQDVCSASCWTRRHYRGTSFITPPSPP